MPVGNDAWEPDLPSVAECHGVPLMKLADAVRFGVLRELGVPAKVVKPMEARLVDLPDLSGGVGS